MNSESAAVLPDCAEPVWHRGRGTYTTPIRGKRIRFYDSPQAGPDWPWVVFADAIALLDFPMSFAIEIADRWQRTWPNMQRELLDGTVIVPDFVVTGMFEFYAECGVPTAEAVGQEYTAVAINLFSRLHGHLSGPEFQAAVRLAGLRNMPTEGIVYAN